MRHTLLTLALLAAPTAVLASGLSYNYADLRYVHTETDSNNINQQGGLLTGSYGFASHFFVKGSAGYGYSDNFTIGTTSDKFNTQAYSLSAGAHYPITPVLDVVADVGALYSRIEGEGGLKGNSKDDTGVLGELGFRFELIQQLEAGAFYSYGRVFDPNKSGYKDAGSFRCDLQFHLNQSWSLVADVSNGSGTTNYSGGMRFNF